MLKALRQIKNSALPEAVSCDEVHLAQCLKAMDIIPHRKDELVSGKLRLNLYKRHLSGFSNEAISYLVEETTRTCHWYPSIPECFEILQAWPNRNRDVERQEKAGHLIQRELNARMDEAVKRMASRSMSQEEVDDLPAFYKQVGVEKGYLRRLKDESYCVWPDTMGMTEEELAAHRERVAKLREEGLL